jgi:hypothetical protein
MSQGLQSDQSAAPPGQVPGRSRRRFPSVRRLLVIFSLLGLVALSYVLGAAVMYFELPSSDFLEKGFIGAEAWLEGSWLTREEPGGKPAVDSAQTFVTRDKPGKTFDGFTLYTTDLGSWATLIDMRGQAVHHWQMPFSKVWPDPSHVRDPPPDGSIHWFRCYLYPNGDLLAVYHANDHTPYGYGLVKLDKDSKLLWAYAGNAHHDVAVAEDGTIYTLTQKVVRRPPAGLESLPGPYIADYLSILSPEGRELQSFPILEAFRDSPYALLLTPVNKPSRKNRTRERDQALLLKKGDILHSNSVRVLGRSLAAKFPLFKAGQVLISLRSLDVIAVLDTQTRTVVWAARGLWRQQHDAEFLDNGHLLVFDNVGSDEGARVLEYDPRTQAIPWSYSSEDSTPLQALERGRKQRLPNGNTLITDPDGSRILEVTPAKQVVWECLCRAQSIAPPGLTSAARFSPKQLTFLKEGLPARP